MSTWRMQAVAEPTTALILSDGAAIGGVQHNAGAVFNLDDEGITWIRGWYAETSPEFIALRAAAALAPTRSRAPLPLGSDS